MLSSKSLRPALKAASACSSRQFSASPAQMATLRELEGRLKSVRNIEKVTKSMKMIATTRLGKAQEAMRNAKGYGEANAAVFAESEADKAAKDENATTASSEPEKVLWIVSSSDRGLCGGIHSSVSKRFRKEVGGAAAESQVVVLGDKSKAQISRAAPGALVLTFNQIGKQVPSFADALAIAQLIEESRAEFDKVNLIYNKVISAIAYEAEVLEVYNANSLTKAPNFAAYEVDDDLVVKDLVDFALANAIYVALVEGHAAEISARRNAMDNASKNAGEMMGKLQMQFNRMRQSQITNDLVDIVTGANALE